MISTIDQNSSPRTLLRRYSIQGSAGTECNEAWSLYAPVLGAARGAGSTSNKSLEDDKDDEHWEPDHAAFIISHGHILAKWGGGGGCVWPGAS